MGKQIDHSMGFLRRLARNQAGNTLALVAAALIPLLGLIGGGVDMSRLYLTKARLQQACDAGALAGRKQMGAGAWSASSGKANTVALELFDANFGANPYGSNTTTRSFTESNGKVTGTASVILPMSVMKVFGQTNKTITTICDAEMRIPNTDVMFVLDTTGSMNDTNSGDTANKITGLKKAVKCFYEALAKLDIDNADCGSTPTGGNSATVQLRFGFVPYATNVNVGRLLNNAWVEDRPRYQTRVPQFTTQTTNDTSTGNTTVTSTTPSTSGNMSGWENGWKTYNDIEDSDECEALVPPNEYSWTGTESGAQNVQSTSSGNTTTYTWYTTQPGTYWEYEMQAYNSKKDRCRIKRRSQTATFTRYYTRTDTITTTTTTVFSGWIYTLAEQDVRGLKAGGYSWNNSVTLPVGDNATNITANWDGCIEERQTWQNTDGDPSNDYDPVPTTAWDMNIDMVPTTDRNSQWKPMLPDAVWGRQDASGNWTTSDVNTTGWGTWVNWMNRNYQYYCPKPSRKLGIYKTSAEVTDFKTYVDSLTPDGNTYHDIGLLWGARLMSPTGLFASENALTSNGGTIERHMIFMTDGDTVTSTSNMIPHGVTWWDRRQATSTSNSVLTANVNARTQALCSAIKNRNITLWVISFGSGVSSGAQTALQNCASSGRYYSAANSTDLIDQFKAIADEISQLRLTN